MSFSSTTIEQLKHVIVIGAGVVGLTTALKIQEKGGYRVTIIAETLPSDPKTIKYTSHWAGAHHVGHAVEDVRQQKMDQETFEVMWELSAPGGLAEGCFLRVPQTEYYTHENLNPHPLEFMPDFQYLPQSSLLPGAISGITFSTVTIDTPIYLNYLLSRFLASGGSIVRGSIQHINQVVEGGARIFSGAKALSADIDAVVVCAGLGARTLGGVEDKDVYPVRGQTVLVRAPWVRFGRTATKGESGTWTYIIPRRSGDVIVGGTRAPDDWFPTVRPETTLDILERAFALCPELAPPEVRAEREPRIDDLVILEEGCGLRPARKGGIRLEVEWVEAVKDKGKVPLVFNYGHAGHGFISSWGSASIALELLEGALAKL